jgi:hypothetical protein
MPDRIFKTIMKIMKKLLTKKNFWPKLAMVSINLRQIRRKNYMFEPSDEKSRKTHELIRRAFTKRIDDPAPYTIAYGYSMNDVVFEKTLGEFLGRIVGSILSSIIGKRISSFVVAFSEKLKEIIIIPINSDVDEVGDAIRLRKEDISSAKFGLEGYIKIKSETQGKDLRFIVPPYTPTTLEDAYILLINQNEEAEAFKNFIKANF